MIDPPGDATPTTAALAAVTALLREARDRRWDQATLRTVLLVLALRIAADAADDATIHEEVQAVLDRHRAVDGPRQ